MKREFLFILISCITFQTDAAEAKQQLLLSNQRYYQALSKKEHPYKIQVLPDTIWDRIIAYSSRPTRKNLKETCSQLAYLTSINRLDRLIIHDFCIGNEKEKNAFFKTLIKTSNPDLVKPFLYFAKKEAEDYYLRNAIHEFDPAYHTEQQYLQEQYITPFLTEATEQNCVIMIDKLEVENVDRETYYKKIQKNKRIKKCGKIVTMAVVSFALLATCGVIGMFISFFGYDCHPFFISCCTQSLHCNNGTILTIPCKENFPNWCLNNK
jgi:hypothetical protein